MRALVIGDFRGDVLYLSGYEALQRFFRLEHRLVLLQRLARQPVPDGRVSPGELFALAMGRQACGDLGLSDRLAGNTGRAGCPSKPDDEAADQRRGILSQTPQLTLGLALVRQRFELILRLVCDRVGFILGCLELSDEPVIAVLAARDQDRHALSD